jgi:hypothetical protein
MSTRLCLRLTAVVLPDRYGVVFQLRKRSLALLQDLMSPFRMHGKVSTTSGLVCKLGSLQFTQSARPGDQLNSRIDLSDQGRLALSASGE